MHNRMPYHTCTQRHTYTEYTQSTEPRSHKTALTGSGYRRALPPPLSVLSADPRK